MNNVEIIELTSAQVELYKEFLTMGLIDDENSFRISTQDELYSPFPTKDSQDSFTLGACIDSKIVGVVSFERDGQNREKLKHKGILFRMYVSKNFRRMGIAKYLIQELLSRVQKNGDIEQINLTVISNNEKALKLYEAFGFKVFGIEENAIKWKSNYFTESQMVLKLKETTNR